MIGWRQQCNRRKEKILTFTHTKAGVNVVDGENESGQTSTIKTAGPERRRSPVQVREFKRLVLWGWGGKKDTLFQFCLSLQVFCCKTIQDKSHITQKHRPVPLWFVVLCTFKH